MDMRKRTLIINFLWLALSFNLSAQSDNDKKFERGLKLMKKYQRVEAGQIFDDIIKSDPDYIDAYYQRALINRYYKKDSLALVDLSVVADRHTDDSLKIIAHTSILDLLFKHEESCSSESLKHIDALTSLNPNSYEGSLYGGICKLHGGEPQDALSEFSKAHNLNEENEKTLFYKSLAEIELNNFHSAIDDLTSVLEKNPKHGEAYFWRAYAYYNLAENLKEKHPKKLLEAALEDLNMAIKYRVREEATYFDRAEVKFELGDYEGAISDFKKVISKNPENVDARYQKAMCYYQFGKEYYAIKELKYIIKKDSNYVDAYYDLAIIYYEKDELEQAHEYADKTIELDQEHADAYLIRGLINIDQGNKEGACKDFHKADEFGDEEAHRDVLKYCD